MVLLLAIALAAAEPAGWRAGTEAFGTSASIEVRGADAAAAETALRAAAAELVAGETDAAELSSRLNAAAGGGAVPVSAAELELLGRALDFCRWSRAAHGPLGGALYALWRDARPGAARLREATAAAGCANLRLDREAGSAALAAGSRVDLRDFAAGWAIDRALERLHGLGIDNARVEVGRLQRAVGPGPSGDGWAVELDLPPEWIEPLGDLWLRDQAVAVAGREPPLLIAGERLAPHLDQRSGRPAGGVVATIAVSELAVDAQPLAVAMFVLGQREGMLRLGALRPEPAVAWLLGGGEGMPLLTTHRWRTRR